MEFRGGCAGQLAYEVAVLGRELDDALALAFLVARLAIRVQSLEDLLASAEQIIRGEGVRHCGHRFLYPLAGLGRGTDWNGIEGFGDHHRGVSTESGSGHSGGSVGESGWNSVGVLHRRRGIKQLT